ncbi:MAG: hypothetical protein H7336_02005 [Bacteriovorax sp.]|nr:hypothetical protein [Bacteriovorax sp.]
MKKLPLLVSIILTISFATDASAKKPLLWQVKNTAWTKSIDKSYEEFVSGIGKAKQAGICNTTSECIKSPVANPKYFNLNPDQLMDVYSDCADLPYILKAYFSWMNDLAFTYPVNMTTAPMKGPETNILLTQLDQLNKDLEKAGFLKKQSIKMQIKAIRKKIYGDKDTDIRYNRFGNIIAEKKYIKSGENINQVLVDVAEAISTATFRTDASNDTRNEFFRDTYPVSISRASIKAGTVLYDPNGHIAVVFEVTPNGKVHLIDAHPDNSLTSITYGEKFTQTNVEIGGGFSNWRPFNADGAVTATSNNDLPDYSLEQFDRKKDFVVNNTTMDFHEYVRNKLSVGTLIYHPVTELTELMDELCRDVKERGTSVAASISAGISGQNHPDKLSSNIYGTDGDWESFSTPSRDARLKASIREGRVLMIKIIEGYKNSDPAIVYEGQDLVSDLKNTYIDTSAKCLLDVKKSNGQIQTLTLNTVLKNIFKLSFDPYHCAELRWGMLDAESLKSCSSSKEKTEWYQVEQGLRNLIDRDYSVKMDYSLKELPGTPFAKIKEEQISIEDALSY